MVLGGQAIQFLIRPCPKVYKLEDLRLRGSKNSAGFRYVCHAKTTPISDSENRRRFSTPIRTCSILRSVIGTDRYRYSIREKMNWTNSNVMHLIDRFAENHSCMMSHREIIITELNDSSL